MEEKEPRSGQFDSGFDMSRQSSMNRPSSRHRWYIAANCCGIHPAANPGKSVLRRPRKGSEIARRDQRSRMPSGLRVGGEC